MKPERLKQIIDEKSQALRVQIREMNDEHSRIINQINARLIYHSKILRQLDSELKELNLEKEKLEEI